LLLNHFHKRKLMKICSYLTYVVLLKACEHCAKATILSNVKNLNGTAG